MVGDFDSKTKNLPDGIRPKLNRRQTPKQPRESMSHLEDSISHLPTERKGTGRNGQKERGRERNEIRRGK